MVSMRAICTYLYGTQRSRKSWGHTVLQERM
jgi:hypothetical protein